MAGPRPATYNKYAGNSKKIEERAMVPVISDHQAANDMNLYCESYPPQNPNSWCTLVTAPLLSRFALTVTTYITLSLSPSNRGIYQLWVGISDGAIGPNFDESYVSIT